MARFPHTNILKLGKSKMVVDVRHCYEEEEEEPHPPCPCPSNCSSSPLHITFYTHSKHRFLDPRRVSLSSLSNSSALLGKHQQVVGEKTICLDDSSLFFDFQSQANFRAAVKTALRSLKVKKNRYGKILKKVIAFGTQYEHEKKKALKNLIVTISIEQNFIGNRDSVHEVLEKSWEESKNQVRGDGDILLVVN